MASESKQTYLREYGGGQKEDAYILKIEANGSDGTLNAVATLTSNAEWPGKEPYNWYQYSTQSDNLILSLLVDNVQVSRCKAAKDCAVTEFPQSMEWWSSHSVSYGALNEGSHTVTAKWENINGSCPWAPITGDISVTIDVGYNIKYYNLKTECGSYISKTYGDINNVAEGTTVRVSCDIYSNDTKYEYFFDGWYDGDTKLSSDQIYDYVCNKNVTLTAKAKRKIKKYTFDFKALLDKGETVDPKERTLDNISGYGTFSYIFTNPDSEAGTEALDPSPTPSVITNATSIKDSSGNNYSVYYGSTFTISSISEDTGSEYLGIYSCSTSVETKDSGKTIVGKMNGNVSLTLAYSLRYYNIKIEGDENVTDIKELKSKTETPSVVGTNVWRYQTTHILSASLKEGTVQYGYNVKYWARDGVKIDNTEGVTIYSVTVDANNATYRVVTEQGEKQYLVSTYAGDNLSDIGVLEQDGKTLTGSKNFLYSEFPATLMAIPVTGTETEEFKIQGWWAEYLNESGEVVDPIEITDEEGKSIKTEKLEVSIDNFLKYYNEEKGQLVFSSKASPSDKKYKLTLIPSGSVTSIDKNPDTGDEDYLLYANVTLSANVKENDKYATYSFDHWERGDDDDTESWTTIVDAYGNPITETTLKIQIYTEDNIYKAIGSSEVIYYTLSLLGNDYISKLNGAGSNYTYKQKVDVSAEVKKGCTFDRWSDGVTDISRTVEMLENTYLTAYGKYVAPQPSLVSSNRDDDGNVTIVIKVTKGSADITEVTCEEYSVEKTEETEEYITYTLKDKIDKKTESRKYLFTIVDDVDETISRELTTFEVYVASAYIPFSLFDSTKGSIRAGVGVYADLDAEYDTFKFSKGFKFKARRKRAENTSIEDVAIKDFYSLLNEKFEVEDLNKTENILLNVSKISNVNWESKKYTINNFKFLYFVGSLTLTSSSVGAELINLSKFGISYAFDLPVNMTYGDDDVQCGVLVNDKIKLQPAIGSLPVGTQLNFNIWLPMDAENIKVESTTQYSVEDTDSNYRYKPLNLFDNAKKDNRKIGVGIGASAKVDDTDNNNVNLFSFGDNICLSTSVDAGGNVQKDAFDLIDNQIQKVIDIITSNITDSSNMNCYLYSISGFKFLRCYGALKTKGGSNLDLLDLTKLPELANINIHFNTCVDNISVVKDGVYYSQICYLYNNYNSQTGAHQKTVRCAIDLSSSDQIFFNMWLPLDSY